MPKSALLAAGLLFGLTLSAQTSQRSAAQAAAGSGQNWKIEQAVTSSISEAWELGGKTEDGFFEIVKALASLSAQKRGLTLPETKEAGGRAGQTINRMAQEDPNQLLYVVVDRAVQEVGIRRASR